MNEAASDSAVWRSESSARLLRQEVGRLEMAESATPAWIKRSHVVRSVIADIAKGRGDTVVLFNSLPRTGSKFLHGVLSAIWDIEHDGYDINGKKLAKAAAARVLHTRGLSNERFDELHRAADRPDSSGARKLRRFEQMREIAAVAPRKAVITTIRDPYDRLLSEFVARHPNASDKLVVGDDTISRFLRFAELEYAREVAWYRREIFDAYPVPEADLAAVTGWATYKAGNLRYVLVRTGRIDAFLNDFVFDKLDRFDVVERAGEMRLKHRPSFESRVKVPVHPLKRGIRKLLPPKAFAEMLLKWRTAASAPEPAP